MGITIPAALLLLNVAPTRGADSITQALTDRDQSADLLLPRHNDAEPALTSKPSASGDSYTVRMRVTAYCPCKKCCGKYADNKTASGKTIWTNGGHFVAAPRHLPFGAMLNIPGYNASLAVPVLDRGGAIKNNRLDVFFFSHTEARKWGVRHLNVTVIREQ